MPQASMRSRTSPAAGSPKCSDSTETGPRAWASTAARAWVLRMGRSISKSQECFAVIKFDLTNQIIGRILPSMSHAEVDTVLRCYPQIYFACHKRHVRDEQTAVRSERSSGERSRSSGRCTGHVSLRSCPPHGCHRVHDVAHHRPLAAHRLRHFARAARWTGAASTFCLTPAGVRIKKQQKVLEPELVAAVLAHLDERKRRQALRGLELLAEASREMIASGDLNRFLKRGAA